MCSVTKVEVEIMTNDYVKNRAYIVQFSNGLPSLLTCLKASLDLFVNKMISSNGVHYLVYTCYII